MSPGLRPLFQAVPSIVISALLGIVAGCGGGAPLLHPAHVLPPGGTSVGAGVSGQLALRPLPAPSQASDKHAGSLQDLGVAPGVAPWVSARLGFTGANELGLTYAGRSIRVDGRHAFSLGRATLSTGLGLSAVIARRPGDGNDASGVFGGGADVPLLIGVKSASDIYALWFGPRAGFEIAGGRLQLGQGAGSIFDVSARHFYGGLLAGIRVGFRHVHAAIELDASYHRVDGSFKTSGAAGPAPAPGAGTSSSVQQLSLTPAGALEISF